MRILLVEDEPKIADFVCSGLAERGFDVEHCTNGSVGLKCASQGHYDAIVLDIMLPGLDGLSVLKALRDGNVSTPRQPPVTPFPVTGMTLTTDAVDGYQVLQFTSARAFTTTETGSDSYANAPGTYRIRYKQVTGAALATLLAQAQNQGRSACGNFQFLDSAGTTTQPTISYCR